MDAFSVGQTCITVERILQHVKKNVPHVRTCRLGKARRNAECEHGHTGQKRGCDRMNALHCRPVPFSAMTF
jgi:hypothetical protein